PSIWACATSMRSNGSRCGPGRAPARSGKLAHAARPPNKGVRVEKKPHRRPSNAPALEFVRGKPLEELPPDEHLTAKGAEPPPAARLPGDRDEARDRGPTARDDDLLSTLHTLEQPGQVGLSLVHGDRYRGGLPHD